MNQRETPESAFRRLRAAWFDAKLRVEDPDDEAYALRERYNADTDAILAGERRAVAPLRNCDVSR